LINDAQIGQNEKTFEYSQEEATQETILDNNQSPSLFIKEKIEDHYEREVQPELKKKGFEEKKYQIDRINSIQKDNNDLQNEFFKGEEGVDFSEINYEKNSNYITQKKLYKFYEKITDANNLEDNPHLPPKHTEAYKKLMSKLKMIQSMEIKPEEIKEYPGSEKGLTPEEDPEFYFQWMYKNMPKQIKEVYQKIIVPNQMELRRNIPREREDASEEEKIHHGTDWYYRTHYDKEYKTCDQTEMPTWEVAEDPNFDEYRYKTMSPGQELETNPELVYDWDIYDVKSLGFDPRDYNIASPIESKMKMVDISVIPYNMPLDQQSMRFACEKWTGFRAISEALYDAAHFYNTARVNARTYKAKEFKSLWPFYNTLPQMCRDNVQVRTAVIVLEVIFCKSSLVPKTICIIRRKEEGNRVSVQTFRSNRRCFRKTASRSFERR